MTKKYRITEHSMFVPAFINTKITEQFKTVTTSEEEKQIYNTVSSKLGEPHPFDYDTIEGIMKKFGLANAVIDKIVDFAVGPNLKIECKDKRGQQILDDFIEKTELRLYLRPWAKEGLGYGSGYLEIAGLEGDTDEVKIKVANAKTMYVKRDKYGNIQNFTQFIGQSLYRISDKDITVLEPERICQLNINKIGSCAYGQGIIYSALQIIDDFLMAQKSIHKLVKRKASSPIHAKLGNVEKDDYPQQQEIDKFGERLQYMDECTEWVTGPNVEFKVIDFGNIGDKFITILANDYKLLSYCFQVPEVILGSGNVPEGLAKVQMDAFDRRIKALQDEIGNILKHNVFKRVLQNNGIDVEFNIVWGELNEEDKDKTVQQYNSILGNMSISPGLKEKIEEKLAELLEINYEDIQALNDKKDAEMEAKGLQRNGQPLPQVEGEKPKPKPNPEREREESNPLPEVPGQKSLESVEEFIKKVNGEFCVFSHQTGKSFGCYKSRGEAEKRLAQMKAFSSTDNDISENVEEVDVSVKEWINFDYTVLTDYILSAIRSDGFDNLRAATSEEKSMGYLSNLKINRLKRVLEDGFRNNLSVKQIERNIIQKVKPGPLFNSEKGVQLSEAARSNMIARSETVRLANIGNLDFYKTKQVEEVRFVASLSNRTCSICEGMNGNIYNVNEAYNIIPVHANCRCAMVPIVRE